MQDNRNDDARLSPRRANPSPPVAGRVHALGESDALRVDLEPVQLPWLADEIDTLHGSIEEGLRLERGRDGELPAEGKHHRSPPSGEIDQELARRGYQLEVLAMIRDQVPLSGAVVAACVASPWDGPSELARELARITAPVTVVGPARGMMVLLRGATCNAADALAEAVRGPERDLERVEQPTKAAHGRDSACITSAVANALRDLAAAAEAFADTYGGALLQQSYSFDPDYSPIKSDELW